MTRKTTGKKKETPGFAMIFREKKFTALRNRAFGGGKEGNGKTNDKKKVAHVQTAI